MAGAVDNDGLQVLAEVAVPTNLDPEFLVGLSGELRDILTPYLSAGDLRTMALVCRDFSSWMEYAGRPELALARWSRLNPDLELPPPCDLETSMWTHVMHGKLGEEPAIATRKVVRAKPRVIRSYINSNGCWCERDLVPGTAVDHRRTTLSADLVLNCQNRVCEHLYHGRFWKWDKSMDEAHPKDWPDPQQIKFKVESLSNKQMPPEQFRVRLTLHIYRHGNDAATQLTWDSPPFWVADIATIRNPSKAVAAAREAIPAKRARRV